MVWVSGAICGMSGTFTCIRLHRRQLQAAAASSARTHGSPNPKQKRPASQQQHSHQHDAILMKSATIVAVFHFWMEFSINEAIGNSGLRLVFTSSPACSNSSNSPGLCNDGKQPFFGHCSPTHQGRITCRPAPKHPSLATRQFP